MSKSNEKPFEENLKRLEEIVSILEKGEVSLENSVEIFEEGMTLSKTCNNTLELIEKKVNILIEDNDGKMTERKFDINGV